MSLKIMLPVVFTSLLITSTFQLNAADDNPYEKLIKKAPNKDKYFFWVALAALARNVFVSTRAVSGHGRQVSRELGTIFVEMTRNADYVGGVEIKHTPENLTPDTHGTQYKGFFDSRM